ncbi:MAG: type II toxin-antitoxin system RelE/ParE family toxin [Alkalinema sp. CAN_BIN05]|nr:type II toxin-antitoxin system RelE/ParE family toxin [Alkalinema sp. CAN_BIN05]
MNRTYEITYAASQDIDSILFGLASLGGFVSAEKFLSRLNAKLKNITVFPLMGIARPEWGEHHRTVPIDHYLVVYRVMPELVEVIRVMSGYQDLDDFFMDE